MPPAKKSAARNTVSHVESCFTNSQDYTACDNTGLTTNEQVPAGDLLSVFKLLVSSALPSDTGPSDTGPSETGPIDREGTK